MMFYPGSRGPLDLPTQTLPRIGRSIRLPSIDEPRLDFQVGSGENLHSQSLKKPWRIARDIGRLISPVIGVLITEQTDVRQENSCVDVDSVQSVDVVAAIGLCDIAIGSVEVPLALRRAGIVAWRRCGIHAKLGHEASSNLVVVEVAAETELLQ